MSKYEYMYFDWLNVQLDHGNGVKMTSHHDFFSVSPTLITWLKKEKHG